MTENNFNKPKIIYPIAVEGKYDKIKLSSIVDARIIVTDGFGIFNDKAKRQMFLRLSEVTPIIIATDSDSAGNMIRSFFKSFIPNERLIHIYIPQLKGKEKRKTEVSKEGYLGVEGMDKELLLEKLLPYSEGEAQGIKKGDDITGLDMYNWGLSGGEGSKEKRAALQKKLSLPNNLSKSALLDVLNMLYSKDHIQSLLKEMGYIEG